MKKKEKQYYKSPMTDVVFVETESLLVDTSGNGNAGGLNPGGDAGHLTEDELEEE